MIDVHALTGAYAIDALDDDERVRFEEHLAVCADCRAEVAGLQEAGAELSSTVSMTPPASLRERVLADVAAVRPLPPEVTSLSSRRRNRRVPAFAAAAAAVVAIGVGGIVWQGTTGGDERPRAVDPTASTQTSTAQRVMDAQDAETSARALDSGGSVTAVRSRAMGQAVVVAQDLPDLPPSKVYELWLRLDGEMVPAGFISPTDTSVLQGDASNAEAIGITVEQAGGAPEGVPTTQPIAYFPLAST